MVVGAGGEKAAKLRGVAVHGRVRVQGEAEELEFHLVLKIDTKGLYIRCHGTSSTKPSPH